MNKIEITISADSIRKFFDSNEMEEELETALDQAQGDAITKEQPITLIITVTP